MGILARASAKARRAAATALESTLYDTAVVLNYHSISVPEQPSDVLSVTPENFRAHMECVAREFAPVTVSSLRRGSGLMNVGFRQGGKRRVAVTFDDGYADNLLAALPALEEFQVPATVFIVSGGIGQAGNFWWDELEELVFERHSLESLLESSSVQKWVLPEHSPSQLTGEEGVKRLFGTLVRHLKVAGPQAAQDVVAELRTQAEKPSARKQRGRSLTLEELHRLANSPMIEIGAHTIHHISLGGAPREMQKSELLGSKIWLEKELGRPVGLLAYPFGDRGDFNRDTLALTRELGFLQAMTTVPGVVTRSSDPFAVPRMFAKNWESAEFGQRLRKFFWTA